MRRHPDGERSGIPDDDLVLAVQAPERDQSIGARHVEPAPFFRRQALPEHEKAEQEVERCEKSGGEKGQAGAIFAQYAAERRPEDESQAKGSPDQPEILRALLRRRDIGDIGIGGAETRAHDPGNDPRDEQPEQCRRKSHQHIGDGIAAERAEQYRSSAETVGQVSDNRSEDKLHRGIGKGQPAGIDRSPRQGTAGDIGDQLRQHGHDDAKAQHVDQHDQENEDQGGLARGSGIGWGHGILPYTPGENNGKQLSRNFHCQFTPLHLHNCQ